WTILPPSEKRLVPSGMTPLPCVARIAVQRFVLREVQDLHSRHSGVYSGMTWSPFLSVLTPGPTSTTTPAPSWPKMTGKSPSGSAPERVNSSVWQMPVARISTRTSPAFGPSSSTSTTSSGLPAAQAIAARVFIILAAPFSGHVQAAVQREIGAGRECRIVRREPGDHGRDLLRRTQSSNRDGADDRRQHLGLYRADHVGADVAR